MSESVEIPTEASDAAWTTLTQLGHFVPGDAVDAALVAARPYLMPTLKEIDAALRDRLVASNFNDNLHEPLRTQTIDVWADLLAGTVVALLNGSKS